MKLCFKSFLLLLALQAGLLFSAAEAPEEENWELVEVEPEKKEAASRWSWQNFDDLVKNPPSGLTIVYDEHGNPSLLVDRGDHWVRFRDGILKGELDQGFDLFEHIRGLNLYEQLYDYAFLGEHIYPDYGDEEDEASDVEYEPEGEERAHVETHTKSSREKANEISKAIRKKMVQNYKIHLMPQPEDKDRVVAKLLQKINATPGIQKRINQIKFNPQGEIKKDAKGNVLPIIVIYPASGKKHAQKVLDFVFEHFGTLKGLDLAPRYNKKITDLIFYAQGDGDAKRKYGKDSEHAHKYGLNHFEDDMVHFAETFTSEGANQGYHLQVPEGLGRIIPQEPERAQRHQRIEIKEEHF